MALWMVRTGEHGQYEQKFLEENRLYLTWGGLSHDLGALNKQIELFELLKVVYPDFSMGKVRNYTGQIWTFVKRIQTGDWVVVPSKHKPVIHIAEVTGEYHYNPNAEDPFYHWLPVKWIANDLPRSLFAQDLLYSFGAFMTVCAIKRNDAEARVKAMAKAGWKTVQPSATPTSSLDEEVESGDLADLEEVADDQIAKYIIQNFKGHELERLVEAILKAQGYTTYRSPVGPDKGIDILAGAEPLGFGNPKICVQVKSSETPADLPTLNQLIGAMQNVSADYGLLVSWGGFKSSIDKETPAQFFRVRLWDQKDLIEQIQKYYTELDEEIRAELPLKQIWTLSQSASDMD